MTKGDIDLSLKFYVRAVWGFFAGMCRQGKIIVDL